MNIVLNMKQLIELKVAMFKTTSENAVIENSIFFMTEISMHNL